MEKPRQVTVVVGGKDYVCDFGKLGGLSDYFKRLFESDFKEGRSGRADLKEQISKEVFDVIFSYMNREEIEDESMIIEYLQTLREDAEGVDNDVSSEEKIFDVMISFHVLHIKPLVTICEKFIIKEMMTEENFERYVASFEKLPNSTGLMHFCFLKFFNVMRKREEFLYFSAEQFSCLVKDESLKAYPRDMVMVTILEWVGCHKGRVESGEINICNAGQTAEGRPEGERQVGYCWKIHLTELFKDAGILLVNRKCLNELLENDLVKECPEAKDVVQDAIKYQEENSTVHRKEWLSGVRH